MTTTRLPLTLTGAADRCCPAGLCVYRPEMIGAYLSVMRQLEEAGEDVGEAADSALRGRGEGRGGKAAHAMFCESGLRIWDVQEAAKRLRASGKEVTAISVATALCPWSLDQ